jgi:hypothetical protein
MLSMPLYRSIKKSAASLRLVASSSAKQKVRHGRETVKYRQLLREGEQHDHHPFLRKKKKENLTLMLGAWRR